MLQAQELAQLEAWFRSVDKDNSGSITAAELAQVRSVLSRERKKSC
jgi:Ca2+-binding EF-hand superfamily protein